VRVWAVDWLRCAAAGLGDFAGLSIADWLGNGSIESAVEVGTDGHDGSSEGGNLIRRAGAVGQAWLNDALDIASLQVAMASGIFVIAAVRPYSRLLACLGTLWDLYIDLRFSDAWEGCVLSGNKGGRGQNGGDAGKLHFDRCIGGWGWA